MRVTTLALCVLSVITSSVDAKAHTPGQRIATIEIEAPSIQDFVLRSTLPIPPNMFPRPDGWMPVAVLGADGQPVPTQVETVTRYPDPAQGADVVEVLARVTLPPGTTPGDRIRYDVAVCPHPVDPIMIEPEVGGIVLQDEITLTATDVYGNVYSASLVQGDGPIHYLKNGSACIEWRTHSTLVLTQAGSGPALPHFLGVHAYIRLWDEEPLLQLDLRIHNGHSGLDANSPLDDPLGKVYFDQIDLRLPRGWTVVEPFPSPTAGPATSSTGGAVYPIVRERADGKLHVIAQQGQFVRRLALAPTREAARAQAYVDEAGLGFCQPGYDDMGFPYASWWSPDTARWFPQRRRLPRLDHVGIPGIQASLTTGSTHLISNVTAGTNPGWPVTVGALGYAHPWGITGGGMVGGTEIHLFDEDAVRTAAAASRDGYRFIQLKHRMYTDRQPNALIDRDGTPSSYLSWVLDHPNGRYLPIWYFGRPLTWIADPFGFGNAPTFQVDEVQMNNLDPDYEQSLLSFEPIDLEHLVRYTNPAKSLVWLGNDSLAKDSLRMQAESFRMGYNLMPNSPFGEMITTGLLNAKTFVDANPGIGFYFGRLEGWGLDAVAATYSFADPAWRATVRPWFGEVIDVVETGQADCSGIIQASVSLTFFNAQYRARQSIEGAIAENALVEIREAAIGPNDPVTVGRINRILIDSFYGFVTTPSWNEVLHGPWSKLAVADLDLSLPPFCTTVPADGVTTNLIDVFQVWSSFAYAHELTNDDLFLQRAGEMIGGPLLPLLEAQGLDNLGNRTALLAFLQESEVGTTFCTGDGNAGPCPCNNDSPVMLESCRHSAGTGMRIHAEGLPSVSQDELVTTATQCPPNNAGIFFAGTGLQTAPLQFLDGLLCVAAPSLRFRGHFQTDGVASDTGFVAQDMTGGFFVPGRTYYFQYYTRDPFRSPCGGQANLSPALSITMQP